MIHVTCTFVECQTRAIADHNFEVFTWLLWNSDFKRKFTLILNVFLKLFLNGLKVLWLVIQLSFISAEDETEEIVEISVEVITWT